MKKMRVRLITSRLFATRGQCKDFFFKYCNIDLACTLALYYSLFAYLFSHLTGIYALGTATV